MDNKYKIASIIIPIATLIIFFIWGWIEGSFVHSWLIFIAAGGAFAVLGVMKKNKNGEE